MVSNELKLRLSRVLNDGFSSFQDRFTWLLRCLGREEEILESS